MESTKTLDGLARVTEVAKFLALSRGKLYLMMDAGEVPFVRFGKSRRIPWQAVRDLVRESTVNAR